MTFGEEVSIRRSEILEDVDFSYATFKRVLNLQETIFHGGIDFRATIIHTDAFLDRAEFLGRANFLDAKIMGMFYSRGSFFRRQAIFSRTIFEKSVLFRPIVVEGKPHPTTFGGEADFSSAKIGGVAVFTGATFKGKASFNSATITGNAFFNPTTFEGEADFILAKIGGNGEFTGATFKGYGDFHSAKIGGEADFTDVKFENKIRLTGTTYNRIKGSLEFLLAKQRVYDPQPYKELEKFLRRAGDDSQADQVFYNRLYSGGDSISLLDQPLRWLGDRSLRWFLGYGVRFQPLLLELLVFLILGWYVFHTTGAVRPHDIEKCPLDHASGRCAPGEIHKLPSIAAFWVSLHTLIPMVDVIAGSGWEPSHNYLLRYKNTRLGITYSAYATLQRFVGWFIWLVALGRITGILQRFAS
jgi:uncharacterized protein YjbI with pentapeptide repeats